MTGAPEKKPPGLVRRVVPWLVGIAILVIIALRVPVDSFRAAVNHGPHVQLALVDFAIMIAMLLGDTFATWVGFAVVSIRVPGKKLLAIRGGTYLLSLLNYAVGQGGLGYYLHRMGVPAMRAASSTLFLIGTTFATLLVITTAGWALNDGAAIDARLWWTLVGGCAAFVVYLTIIAAAPRFLARREIFGALFDAKLGGHALAILARTPHVMVIVFGHYVAMLAWGIDVPFAAAATLMPAVVIASVLPISPNGLGTTQASLVFFFGAYAAGATDADRSAAMLAFSIVHFVYCTVWQALVGVVSLPFARRVISAQAP